LRRRGAMEAAQYVAETAEVEPPRAKLVTLRVEDGAKTCAHCGAEVPAGGQMWQNREAPSKPLFCSQLCLIQDHLRRMGKQEEEAEGEAEPESRASGKATPDKAAAEVEAGVENES